MNRNALVIHENKCTSSIFIFMLRFSVDFLWIGVSEWTVRFSLCLEMHTGLGFPPGHYPNTLVYMKWFRKHFCRVLFSPLHCRDLFWHVPYSNHRSKILCQTLMKKPKCLRLDSLVLSKEGLPVCPRAAARHGWALGRAAHTTRPRVLMLTPHRLQKDGCLILRNHNHI